MPMTTKEMLDKVWGDFVGNEEKKRRNNRLHLIDYYEGDQEKFLEPYLKLEEKLDIFPYYYTNITKKIINKKSEVYKLAPLRTFGEKTEEDDAYEKITKKKDVWLKVCERQANLLGTIGLRPIVVADGGKFDYTMIRDFQAYFKGNNLAPFAIRFPVETAAHERDVLYDYWSAEEHLLLSADNVIITDPEKREQYNIEDDGSNRYGVIPYVFLHSSEVIDDFWNTGHNADDLKNANLHINMKLSAMSHKYRFKSFNPIWVSGIDSSEDVKVAYDRLLILPPADAEAGTLNAVHQFVDDIEVIKFEMQLIERNYNLNITWGIEGSAPSGFSLVVQNMAHADDLEDFTDVARVWEDELLEMERKVAEVDKLQGVPADDVRVDFTEIRTPISQEEKNKKWEFEFANKLSTRRDYWRSENPDISDDEMDKREEELAEEVGKLNTEPDLLNNLLGGDNA